MQPMYYKCILFIKKKNNGIYFLRLDLLWSVDLSWLRCVELLRVVFNSLTKDMTGKEDVYRGPAIRALCRITDVIPALLNSFSSLMQ